MADFKKAFDKIVLIEGGYVNDPNDPGGETYKGISRRFNPDWRGWKIIDSYTVAGLITFPGISTKNLDLAVEELYQNKYWNILNLDAISDQLIAEEIFDISVNQSPRDAAKTAQRALNIVNQNQRFFGDINIDGQIGPVTINLLNKFLDKPYLAVVINLLQAAEYISECERNHSQEKYFRGWIKNRCLPIIKNYA